MRRMKKHTTRPVRSSSRTASALGLGLGVVIVSGAVAYAMQRRRDRSGFTLAEWNTFKEEDGSVRDFHLVLQEITEKGVDLGARRELWPYLLGLYSPKHTDLSKQAIYEAHKSSYETLLQHCQELEDALQRHLGKEAVAAAARAAADEADRIAQEAAMAATAAAAEQPALLVFDDVPGTSSSFAESSSYALDALDGADLPCPSGPTLILPSPRNSLTSEVNSRPATADDVGLASTSAPVGDGRNTGGHSNDGGDGSGGNTSMMQFCEAQRIIVMDAIRSDFQKNSLTKVDELKSWWRSTIADNSMYQNLTRTEEWWRGYWLSDTAHQALEHASQYSSEQKRQLARLINLLSAYAVHDPETGYCQGMSDLALPFLMLMEDDTTAFWCFEHLMRKIRKNFAIDETGIFLQLTELGNLLEEVDGPLHYRLRQVGAVNCHFAYRMIVVLMRRELPLDQALRLWEMCWADDALNRNETIETQEVAAANALVNQALQGHSRCASWQAPPVDDQQRNLFRYFVASVVASQRRKLLDGCSDSDDIIKHFQTLRVNLWECMARARELRMQRLGDDAPLHQRRKAAAAYEVPAPPASAIPVQQRIMQQEGGVCSSPSEQRHLMVFSDEEELSPPSSIAPSVPRSVSAFLTGMGVVTGLRTPPGGQSAVTAAVVPSPPLSPPAPPMLQRLQSALAAAFIKPQPEAASRFFADAQQPSLLQQLPQELSTCPRTMSTPAVPTLLPQPPLPTLKQPAQQAPAPPKARSPPPPPAPKVQPTSNRHSPQNHYEDDEEEDEPEGRPLLG